MITGRVSKAAEAPFSPSNVEDKPRIAGEVPKKKGLVRRALGVAGGALNSPLLWVAPSLLPAMMPQSENPMPDPGGMTPMQKAQMQEAMYQQMVVNAVNGGR